MAIDARNHIVPTGGSAVDIEAIVKALSLSVNDIVHVADNTARATLVSDLAVAGYTVNADNPLYVHNKGQAAGKQLQSTVDGSTWNTHVATSDTGWFTPAGSPGGWNSSNSVRVKDGWATINVNLTAASIRAAGTITGVMNADSRWAHTVSGGVWFLVNGPEIYRAIVSINGAITIYFVDANASGNTIRGTVTYPVG